MLEQIQAVFSRVTGITDYALTPKTKLNSKDLSISSFTIIQLVCELEDEFGVDISNSTLKRMKTVKDIMDFLAENIST